MTTNNNESMKELEPYLNKVIQGDCLEEMKNIPDGSVDAVICDLWETKPTFEVKRRMITWLNNVKVFSGKTSQGRGAA